MTKPNASRPDGPTTLPASAGACDPRPMQRRARRDATIASEEYTRRIRALLLGFRADELALADRIEAELTRGRLERERGR